MSWFTKNAPLRTKFAVLTAVYTMVALSGLATTYLAAITDPSKAMIYVWIEVGLAVLTVMVALFSTKAICEPVANTVVRMEGLANGDLSSPVRYTDHEDCVGRLTKAMAVFRENAEKVQESAVSSARVVSQLGVGLEALSRRDLTVRLQDAFPPEYEVLRRDFNGAIDALAAVIGVVADASGAINAGAGDISQASEDLSHRTEQQAASLEQTAAAMEEITGAVRQTAADATRANTLVGDAREEAEQSGDVVRRAVMAMDGIERTSAEISDIIGVIDGIAFQTNLLALNAGVEAARAGDAGRGFAVVASEVRALAQRSADAASDVKSRISASSVQVEAGVKLVSETGATLERIINRVGSISDVVETIARSAEHQAGSLQQVNTAVAQMDGVTQQNAAMVEEATAAARSLASEAAALDREVAQFIIQRRSSARPVPAVARASHISPARSGRGGVAMIHSSRGSAAVAIAEEDWSDF